MVNECFVFICGGGLVSEMVVASHVSDSSSIRDISRGDGMVVLKVHLYGRVLRSANCVNIMENNTCHNDVACPLWVTLSFRRHYEYAYHHLHSGSCPAVGSNDIESLLGSQLRVRVRGHQEGQAWVPSVLQNPL